MSKKKCMTRPCSHQEVTVKCRNQLLSLNQKKSHPNRINVNLFSLLRKKKSDLCVKLTKEFLI